MKLFVIYDKANSEYLLQPAGYALFAAILILLFIIIYHSLKKAAPDNREPRQENKKTAARPMRTKELVFCAVSLALAAVTSTLKIASLPYGGSITLFSMLFVVLPGYFFGPKTGIAAGAAFGILSFLLEPYIYAPAQLLLDYPLAFGALGLCGFFYQKKHGLCIGYCVGVIGRYLCHVISGYVFFANYAPKNMNPLVYTLGYNLTYILPEMIVTVIILSIPSVSHAIRLVRSRLSQS